MATVDQIEVVMSADVSDYLAGTKAAIVASERAEKAIAASAVKVTAAKTMEARAALDTATSAKNASAITIAAARGGLLAAQSAEKSARAALANVSAQQSEASAFRASAAAVTAKIAANNALVVSENNVTAASRHATSSFSGIGAQFQDIGVTAAMGMNPLMIALQQGTQLSAQLQQSAKNGQSVWAALGTGIASVLNPISIATIATIALGTAAIQYFGAIIADGQVSTEELKKQNDVIRDIAERWGEVVPALREYVDKLDQADAETAAMEGKAAAQAQEWATVRAAVGELGNTLASLSQDLVAAGANKSEIEDLNQAFRDLDTAARDGTDSTEEAGRVTEAVAALMRSSGIPAIQELVVQWAVLASQIAIANNAAAAFDPLGNVAGLQEKATAGFIANQERINGLTGEQLDLENEISRVKAEAARGGAVLSDIEAETLATSRLSAEERRRAEQAAKLKAERDAADEAKGGNSAAKEYDTEREAMEKLLETMGIQVSLLGATNKEKAISAALSRANASASAEELAIIGATAGYIYDTEQAIKNLNETSKMWSDTLQTGVRGIIDDLLAGKTAAEAFGNALQQVGSKLIDVGLDSLFGSSGFNIAGMFGGARATGGPVSSGKSYLVGELGPEMFTPSSAGNITPNNQMGGSSSVVFSPVIDARGADVGAVARIERVLEKMKNEIVPTIRHEISIGPKKGRGR